MTENLNQTITPQIIAISQTYTEYREMVQTFVQEGKTTGPFQTEAYLEYTKMANQRMNRWDKTAQVSEEMKELVESLPSQTWLVITEAWCGDAGQSLPYINKLAELNPGIQLRIILRDENLEVMDRYLTNGARSIPKLISLSPDLESEYFVWGPKPQFLIDKFKAFKADPQGQTSKEYNESVQLWYARDKNQSLEKELKDKITEAFVG